MLENIFIRSASTNDVATIYDFICELEEEMFEFDLFQQIFIHNLQNSDCHYLLAFNNDIPVGYASVHAQWLLHHCGKVGEIQEMFVVADYRGKGVGKLLIGELIKLAQNNNFEILEVTTNMRRLNTHQFYEHSGLKKTHFKFVKKLK